MLIKVCGAAAIERENCVSAVAAKEKRKRRRKHTKESSAMSVCESKEKLGDFSLAVRHTQKYLEFTLENLLSVNF